MGHIGIRTSDELEKEFTLEAASKGKNKSDYLKEIIEARHAIDFLKNNDGLLIILTQNTLARFQYFAGLKNITVDVWVTNLLHEMYFDMDGNPCTDTSIFQNPEIGTQLSGKQAFTDVNAGVNSPVNGRKQVILQNLPVFVHRGFEEIIHDFYENPREDLISMEYLQTIIDFVSDNTKSDTFNAIEIFQILLKNVQNSINYYFQQEQNALTQLRMRQLNYMLYEGIKAEEVQKVETFFEFLNTFK
ncbi:hypothetical protein VB776_06910 [Arcicella sp. DC2W]|uniref:Uncharacterized protein n=1 Tax=Arcicella gelida TaxID=2984195 RepID=A0ABU5S2D5_9BACT|nr:hypothetical protein [Arcicella sp. DC2W]MEA5402637.1 hypothetical protein [Arcicella sp. DC2W]